MLLRCSTLFIYLFIIFWGRISLFSSGWPRTCYVDQADRKLKEVCQPLSPGILRLLVCTTIPNLFHYLQDYFYYSFICPCAYICCMYAGSCIDKGVLGPLEWSCRHLWAACLAPVLRLLEGRKVVLTAESSLQSRQPLNFLFWSLTLLLGLCLHRQRCSANL